jgi:AcrR family transcriptional regulator
MRLEGRTTDQICRVLGIKPRTLYLWFSDPRIKAELQSQLEQVSQLFTERLVEAGFAAIRSLQDLAAAELSGPVSPEIKLRASQAILERALEIETRRFSKTNFTVDDYVSPPPGSFLDKIARMTPDQVDRLKAEFARRIESGDLPTRLPEAPQAANGH